MAVFSLYHTIRGEKKYKLDSFVPSELEKYRIEKGDPTAASRYEAVNYFILEDLLKHFQDNHPGEKNFLDAGCGKGRALVVAAHYGFTQLTGVDFAKELCVTAEKNLQKVAPVFPEMKYRIICDDILNYPVTNETVFFLFNPFDETVLAPLLTKIENSTISFPRIVYFLYASPKHRDLLLKHGYTIEYEVKKVKYLEGLIAHRDYISSI
jgi:SAM-dependent methyltransferase